MMNWNHQCFCFCHDLQLPKFCFYRDHPSPRSLQLSGRNIVSEFCIYRVHIPFKLSSVTNLTYQLRRTAFSWQEMGDSRKYQGYRADGPRYECGTVSGESPQWLECMSPQTCC